MVKIKEYKIRASGVRGLVVSLPQVWVKDNDLRAGDAVDVYRDEEDRLILRVVKNGQSKES